MGSPFCCRKKRRLDSGTVAGLCGAGDIETADEAAGAGKWRNPTRERKIGGFERKRSGVAGVVGA